MSKSCFFVYVLFFKRYTKIVFNLGGENKIKISPFFIFMFVYLQKNGTRYAGGGVGVEIFFENNLLIVKQFDLPFV
jgi:hypothetical protein